MCFVYHICICLFSPTNEGEKEEERMHDILKSFLICEVSCDRVKTAKNENSEYRAVISTQQRDKIMH